MRDVHSILDGSVGIAYAVVADLVNDCLQPCESCRLWMLTVALQVLGCLFCYNVISRQQQAPASTESGMVSAGSSRLLDHVHKMAILHRRKGQQVLSLHKTACI